VLRVVHRHGGAYRQHAAWQLGQADSDRLDAAAVLPAAWQLGQADSRRADIVALSAHTPSICSIVCPTESAAHVQAQITDAQHAAAAAPGSLLARTDLANFVSRPPATDLDTAKHVDAALKSGMTMETLVTREFERTFGANQIECGPAPCEHSCTLMHRMRACTLRMQRRPDGVRTAPATLGALPFLQTRPTPLPCCARGSAQRAVEQARWGTPPRIAGAVRTPSGRRGAGSQGHSPTDCGGCGMAVRVLAAVWQ
jgi:hypothetical protein